VSEAFGGLDLEQLTEKYLVQEKEFDVILSEGEVLRFRALLRKEDLNAFIEAGIDWVQSLPLRGTAEARGHEWEEWLPQSHEEAMDAYALVALSVVPKFDELTALKWLRAPWVLREVMDQIETHSKTLRAARLADAVASRKKNSATPSADGKPSKSERVGKRSTRGSAP
jgi:hypothetical protein